MMAITTSSSTNVKASHRRRIELLATIIGALHSSVLAALDGENRRARLVNWSGSPVQDQCRWQPMALNLD
jgi:hypothetical protein